MAIDKKWRRKKIFEFIKDCLRQISFFNSIYKSKRARKTKEKNEARYGKKLWFFASSRTFARAMHRVVSCRARNLGISRQSLDICGPSKAYLAKQIRVIQKFLLDRKSLSLDSKCFKPSFRTGPRRRCRPARRWWPSSSMAESSWAPTLGPPWEPSSRTELLTSSPPSRLTSWLAG